MSVLVANPPSLELDTIRYGLKDVTHFTYTTFSFPPTKPPSSAGRPYSSTESEQPKSDPHDDPDTTSFDLEATRLMSSPYLDLANHLNLQQLDSSCRLFAFASTLLKPARRDYATAPYLASFNWPLVFRALRQLCSQQGVPWQRQEYYLVIFRSQRRRGSDGVRLAELDQRSHEEACASGGLLKYWFGACDGEMRNLATCIWRNREDAAQGGRGPWHRKARSAAREMYESISFETYRFVVEDGAERWRLEESID